MLDNIRKKIRDARGFTLTELTAVIVVLGIILVPISVLTINFFGGMIARNLETQLAVESQTLLRSVVEELRLGAGVRASNLITDVNEPPAGWTTSNNDLVLIVATPALNASKHFIYDPLTGDPYLNEIIYFADGDKLYKRFLANTSASGNTMQTSCPASAVTASCPADRVLSKHFKDMNFTFYDQDDATTTNLSLARSLIVNVEMEQATFGRDITFNNAMRMTLRNQL